MGYRREDYIKVNGILANRRAKAESDADRRRETLYNMLPELRLVDRQLAMTGSQIISAIGGGPNAIRERMAEIEAENVALQVSLTI